MTTSEEQKPMGKGIVKLVAVVLAVFVLVYTGCVFAGWIAKDNRIDVTHLALIGFSMLALCLGFYPSLLSELKIFEFGSMKLEFEKVKKEQEEFFEGMRLLLPLILPDSEIEHLRNLVSGSTENYSGGGTLRSEIRRLRSRNLLEMRTGKSASDMGGGEEFDLTEYVRITEFGRQWLRRVEQFKQQEVKREREFPAG